MNSSNCRLFEKVMKKGVDEDYVFCLPFRHLIALITVNKQNIVPTK